MGGFRLMLAHMIKLYKLLKNSSMKYKGIKFDYYQMNFLAMDNADRGIMTRSSNESYLHWIYICPDCGISPETASIVRLFLAKSLRKSLVTHATSHGNYYLSKCFLK